MTARDPKTNLRSSLLSLLLTSSLVGGVTSCSFSEAPSVTQVPPTLSAQAPETPATPPESISFYYDGVKTSIRIEDAAILFAANFLKTNNPERIVNFVNNTLKAGPITAGDVTALGNPLDPAISDFTGDGKVDINDVAVLFAVASLGENPPRASRVNTFISGTLKLPGVTVTQAQLDSYFSAATPTPTPTATPTPTPTATPTPTPTATPTPTPTATPTPTPTPTVTPTPTPTPTPAAQFYVHPTLGNDNNLGTSPLRPFQNVRKALNSPGVWTAAGLGGGTNVIVTILDDGTEQLTNDFASLDLPLGSVTVVPDSGVNFTLNLNNRTLTLKKGYTLQGIQIISGDPGGNTGSGANKAAIILNAAGTPLKNININCTSITPSGVSSVGGGDKCVHVPSNVGGTVILDNVDISIPSDKNFVTGILHEGTGTLKVINGSSVVAAGSGSAQGVVGIYGKTTSGSVEVSGSTVSLSAITATGGNVFSILLSGPIASGKVEGGSTIQVREGNGAIAIGVCVNATGTVTVQGNTFTNSPSGSNSIAIYKQSGTVVPTPMPTGNTFTGFSTSPEKRYVESDPNLSCP